MPTYNPSALLPAARARFYDNYVAQASWVPTLAFLEQSDKPSESYPWVGQMPTLQLLLDTVAFSGVSDTNYVVYNYVYTGGVEFKRTDIANDINGILQRRIDQLAIVAASHPNKLMTALITGGTSGLGYDGNAFFSATHPNRGLSGVWSNTAAGSGTTTAAFATDFAASKAALLNLLAENGEPIHGDGADLSYYVMVPPALEKIAREAMNASIISNTSNVLQGAASVLVNPRLTATDVNDWYTFAVAPTRKPFIHQEREALEFTAQDSSSGQESDAVFERELYRFKTRAYYGQAYGYPQCAFRTTNA